MPQHLLKPFDERELELIIGGLGKIDIEDWKANTRLKVRSVFNDMFCLLQYTVGNIQSEVMTEGFLQSHIQYNYNIFISHFHIHSHSQVHHYILYCFI